MQQLLGDRAGLNDTFLKELFLQRLPNSVRMVLAASPGDTPLENLAELADRVVEVAGCSISSVSQPVAQPTPPNKPDQVSTVTPELPCQPTAADFDRILSQLSKLQTTVKSLTHASSVSPRRRRKQSPSAASSPDRFCWYHWKQLPKRVYQALAMTNPPGQSSLKCHLLHMHDPTNHLTFLIDTGAAISVIPPSASDGKPFVNSTLPSSCQLFTHSHVWQEITHPLPWPPSFSTLDLRHCRGRQATPWY